MKQYLSKYLCGYRKNFNRELARVPMIEKWREVRDNGKHSGGVLMDLSKAFKLWSFDSQTTRIWVWQGRFENST